LTEYKRIERKSRSLEHTSLRIKEKEAWIYIVVERDEKLTDFYKIFSPSVIFQLMVQDAAYLDGDEGKKGKVSKTVIIISIIFAALVLGCCFVCFLCMIRKNLTRSKTGLETEEVDELEEYDDPILKKSKERRRKFIERKRTLMNQHMVEEEEEQNQIMKQQNDQIFERSIEGPKDIPATNIEKINNINESLF